MQKILCAAVWIAEPKIYQCQPKNIESGIVVSGRRHHNCYATLDALNPSLLRNALDNKYPVIEGFLTDGDVFVTREIGANIAYNAGQIPDKINLLISENLY